MKIQLIKIHPNGMMRHADRTMAKFGMAVAHAAFFCLGSVIVNGQENETTIEEQGMQVLTRGPIHEAFAGMISYNPEPGIIVDRPPPEDIEEVPPEERPVGDNITWIPGYWSWDDERSDHVWVSGTWRALPPGRQWITGYWGLSGGGHQWTSGYWADAALRETTYLPRPPMTVEIGPNVTAPTRDHVWSPGSWMWQQERYAWSPGFWTEGRSDWDWTPAHYVWTPRGHVYVNGYWDYSMDRRGVLYAPVHFQSSYSSRAGFHYSPVVAIGLAALVEHLFLRPKYQHYYFGDYYDRRYSTGGYYPPHVFQSNRYGYDPVYSYQRWSHRQDSDWERRHVASYDYRRDHESARPPRTWIGQKRLRMDEIDAKDRHNYVMATNIGEMSKQSDRKIRIRRVSEKERNQLADQGREVRKNRAQRRVTESEGMKNQGEKKDLGMKPTKVMHPASPIVRRSRDQLSGTEAPPKPYRASDADRDQPSDRKAETDKVRPKDKKEQTSSRHEAVPKDKDRKDPSSIEKIRPENTNVPPYSRRGEDSKEKEHEGKSSPNQSKREETGKETQSVRREAELKTKEPERKTKKDMSRKEGERPVKAREQGKMNPSEIQDRKSAKPASGRKSDSDKEESDLSDEESRRKE